MPKNCVLFTKIKENKHIFCTAAYICEGIYQAILPKKGGKLLFPMESEGKFIDKEYLSTGEKNNNPLVAPKYVKVTNNPDGLKGGT